MRTAAASLMLLALTASAAAPRGVVIVSVDSLRADRVGVYGSTRGATPALDALAAEGTLFESAYSQAPTSLPSHASLFTGLYPRSHGAIGAVPRLSTSVPTLAERLSAEGLRAAAFTGGFSVQGAFGLSRGFEVYADSEPRAGLSSSVDKALSWAAALPADARFLLFVHGYDAHPPWSAPREALLRYAPAGDAPLDPLAVDFSVLDGSLPPGAGPWLDAYYDGAVSHADAQVARLRAGLERLGLWDGAVVVALSDHGQLLADHLWVTASPYGELFEDSLRVPLIIKAPGAAARRVSATVELVDVAPTLLELLASPALPGAQGRSLAAAVRGGDARSPRPVVSQSPRRGAAPCAGLRERGLLLARCPGRSDALFEPRADARLRQDLAASRPDDARALSAEMTAWEARSPERASAPADADWRRAREAMRRAAPWLDRRADPAALRRLLQD